MNLEGQARRERLIEHKGRKIFVRDFSHLSGDETADLNSHMTDEMLRRGSQDALLLINVTGCTFSKESIGRIKTDVTRSNECLKKVAVVGVKGILRVFFRTVSKFFMKDSKSFVTETEGLDWLVSEK